MIIVTGGAGFIGSQIVKGLNQTGATNIVIVDNLTNGHKFRNLAELHYADYYDKQEFLNLMQQEPRAFNISAIFHQGACSATTEWDGRYMMSNNFTYSKAMLNLALTHHCPLIYASSAATHGGSNAFIATPVNEQPINVYGYSKLLFDQYVRRLFKSNTTKPPIVGLRYFNVYGHGEYHKGNMASVAYHFNNQLQDTGECRLFEGSHGYDNGGHLRDFVAIEDIVKLNLWFLKSGKSGIFNAGTGRCQSFNDVADAVIAWHGKGQKTYIPFPEKLKAAYQSFTQADLTALREAGYPHEFANVHQGVHQYLDILNQSTDRSKNEN